MEKIRKVSFFTTAACNLNCEHCIMGKIKDKNRNYQMSLDEVEAFLDISKKSGYEFHFTVSGGEPLLWTNLKEGVRMIRESGICAGIRMFTNAINLAALDDATAKKIDQIRISKYLYNTTQTKYLKERYGNRVTVVGRESFWFLPNEPLAETTPAECEYLKWWYYDKNVYACAHCQPLSIKLGYNKILHTPLALNFAEKLYPIKEEIMQDLTGPCTICTTNGNFKKKATLIQNKPNAILFL